MEQEYNKFVLERVPMKYMDLTSGDLSTHIRRIAIPASIGFLFNTMFNVVDSFYAGQLGTDALAGLALSFPIFFLIIALSGGVGNGTSTLTAIALGKRNDKEFHQLVLNATTLAVVIGLVFGFAAPYIVAPLFQLIGASGDALRLGVVYTQTIFYGTVFFTLNFAFNGMLSSQGNTKPFRNYLVLGFFLNLFLDPLFIFGWFGLPALGTVGVALATIVVQAIGAVYMAYKVTTSDAFDWSMIKQSTLSWTTIKDLLRQGIPASLNSATIALGVFVINYFVLLYGGDTTIAAYGVSLRIEQLILLPTIGLNIAVLAIVGQSFGAGNIQRIHEVRALTTKYGVIIMVIGMAIVLLFAQPLIQVFDRTPAVVDAGVTYLRIATLVFVAYIPLNISVSVLQGIKKPNFAIYIGVFRQLLPFAVFYFLGTTLGLGIFGVWYGIVVVNWVAVILSLWYTKRELARIVPS
jgi:putative MATE family efflux protein